MKFKHYFQVIWSFEMDNKEGHAVQVLCTAWKDDGSTVFSAGCDKQAKMWPILSGGQPVQVGMHDAPIKDIAWVPEMNLLVTGSWDKTVK
jgi:mRNA export factor